MRKDKINEKIEETEGLPSCMKFSPCTASNDLGIPGHMVAGGLLTDLGGQIKERQPHKPPKLPNINLENVVGKL